MTARTAAVAPPPTTSLGTAGTTQRKRKRRAALKVAQVLQCTLCGKPALVYADDTAAMVRISGVPVLVCKNCEALWH